MPFLLNIYNSKITNILSLFNYTIFLAYNIKAKHFNVQEGFELRLHFYCFLINFYNSYNIV